MYIRLLLIAGDGKYIMQLVKLNFYFRTVEVKLLQ
jgi:hypothetical protein